MRLIAITILSLLCAVCVASEVVSVRYHGPVNLDRMDCDPVTRSSFIQRICYNQADAYAVVNLSGTYYHYCEVPALVITQWFNAPSMGQFYNARIKGGYDCRYSTPPEY